MFLFVLANEILIELFIEIKYCRNSKLSRISGIRLEHIDLNVGMKAF